MKVRGRVLVFIGLLLILLHGLSGLRIPLPSDETAYLDFPDSGIRVFNNKLFLVAGIMAVIIPMIKSAREKRKEKKEMMDSFLGDQAGESKIKTSPPEE